MKKVGLITGVSGLAGKRGEKIGEAKVEMADGKIPGAGLTQTVEIEKRGPALELQSIAFFSGPARQPTGTRAARSGVLVILPCETGEPNPVSPDTILLGLPLLARTVLAARRAGFERVLVPASHALDARHPLPDGLATTVVSPAELSTSLQSGRIVLLGGNVLARAEWLQSLLAMPMEPARLYLSGRSAAVIETAAPWTVASALSGAMAGGDAFGALLQALPAAQHPLGGEEERFEVATREDLAKAEGWLLRGLVKDVEGFMSRHVGRRVSLALTRRLAPTRVTPTVMTLISAAIGLVGSPFFLSSRAGLQIAGALLFLAHSILDGCDGELARLKFQETRRGGLLDFWMDNVVHAAVFSSMAVGWSLAARAAWPLLVGGVAVAATSGTAVFVYWHRLRPKNGGAPMFTSVLPVSPSADRPLSRAMDAVSHRDFIYLILILSLFGKAAWFLVAAAAGTPVFLLLLVWIERRESEER